MANNGAADACAAPIFEALGDFKHLTRERALESLRAGLRDGRYTPEEVEPLAMATLASASWEARQGGLAASAEAITVWDRPAFRKDVLRVVPELLIDPEYRVRKAVSLVLRACCEREGLQVYDAISDTVLGDIRAKFRRQASDKEPEADPGKPTAPPTFLPDTEGWRSLETSMGALEAMMQGCGAAFTPRINVEMLDLIAECSKHTNRFVREYAFFALKNAYEVCSREAFLESVAPQTVSLVAKGIADNWSQVRYAGSVAARAFMQKAGDEQSRFFPQLLGAMCLNRHYVAEGVRLFSQETWKVMCGPQGGARLIVSHFDNVIDAYVAAAEAPNHAVREAACQCISELASKVAGTPERPTPFRDAFTQPRVQRLLQTLLGCFQDESWPVRDCASTAVGYFVVAFPQPCEEFRTQLVDLWFEQMSDNIPSLRQNGAAALAMAVGVWTTELWDDVVERLRIALPAVQRQEANSQIFTDYTPSGPFSVPKPKPMSFKDDIDPAFTNQTMYSCGSVAPKTFKRRPRAGAGGCMNCSADQPRQLWEASEGMVYLMVHLAALCSREVAPAAEARSAQLADMLPTMISAFECSHYRHHHLLKQRACEHFPALTQSLGAQLVLPHLPGLLRATAACAAQTTHLALREAAEEALAAWRRQFAAGDLEAARASAGLDAQVLPAAAVAAAATAVPTAAAAA